MLLFILFKAHASFASHLMGSDITYKCLGNNKYRVMLTVYRDCKGTILNNDQFIKVMSDSTRQVQTFTIYRTSVKDITGFGDKCSVKSPCSGGSFPYGIEAHTYKGEIDVSIFWTNDVIISWRYEARNSNISTGAADKWFYTEAFILRGVDICNNSPVFTTPAAALICAGSDFSFNNGTLDTLDGDSLSYSFAMPFSDKNKPIDYVGNWSMKGPVTYFGFPNPNLPLPQGFHLDPITGNINFRPTVINEASVIVLEVTEWRKVDGVMRIVGKTRRDIQVVVVNCNTNSPPEISGQSVTVCANSPVDITIKTSDKNTGDSVKVDWNRGIAGADFVSSAGTLLNDTAVLHWEPKDSDVRTIPYIFTVTAKDNACPLSGQAVAAFYIFVKANPPAPSFDVNDSIQCFEGHSFDFSNNTDTGWGGYVFEWGKPEGGAALGYNLNGVRLSSLGVFGVGLKVKTNFGCVDSTGRKIQLRQTPKAAVGGLKNTYCLNDPPTPVFADLIYGQLQGKNIINNRIVPRHTGYDTVYYKITIDGCSADTSIPINVLPLPELDLGRDTTYCIAEPINFDVSFPGAQYLWHDGSQQPFFSSPVAGKFSVTLFHYCGTLKDEVIRRDCDRVFVPTSFTPNGDGKNDVFAPHLQNVVKMRLQVFDRWGGLVFSTQNAGEAWDGKMGNGIDAPPGVYLWQLSVTFNNLGYIYNHNEGGNLTLIR